MTPAYKAKPTTMWASVSDDEPPEIWAVDFYREGLQSNLRHIRVTVTPIIPKRKTR